MNGVPSFLRDAQQLVLVLVADAQRHRHRHDAAQHRRPERVEELLVVVQQQDHPVTGTRSELLQVMQDAQCALVQLTVGHAPRFVFAAVIDDGAVCAVELRHQFIERAGLHGVSLPSGAGFDPHDKRSGGAQIDQCLELDRVPVHRTQPEPPGEAVQVHQHFVDRQRFADTVVRARGKRQVGQLGPRFVIAGEAIGVERLRRPTRTPGAGARSTD